MSLASASPRRASLDSDVIHIVTSPLPSSPRPHTARSRHRHQALQPPATAAGALPPARSSSPRHHAHVSSAALNNTTNSNASPPRHINNYFSPSPSPSRRLRHSLASQHRPLRSAAADAVTGNNRLRAQPSAATSSYDQHLIDDFLRNEFYSTTSPYASFTNPPPPSNDDIYQGNSYTDLHSQITTTTTITTQNSDCMGRANDAAADVPDSPSQQLQAGPSANTTQNTDYSLNDESQYSPLFPDLLDDQGVTETAATSFSETMPAATTTLRRGHSDILPTPKRQRGNLPAEHLVPPQERLKPLGPEEDLFGDVPPAPTAVAEDDLDEKNLTTIDLTEATGVLPELREPIVDNRIKIAAFQCAICMDDVVGLTVTYCGHLFCAICLHQSLTNVESLKGRCPMCRSKIDTKLRGSYTTKTKGFWPLELKLMTKTRRGKRKAEDITK
ncbi:SUMO-targeted ubiquitin ligase complex subunit slx8 [Beauveria asiatica]|uniref:SUMO-targeted ubiquitin ligase complex subunit slx8 n=1 Tax=Beauveria asiatica TaxID=1069075 RepID=A0AAW0S7C8_9HYPO